MSITNELIFPVYQFRVLSVRIDHLPARLQLLNIYILNSFVDGQMPLSQAISNNI